MYIGPLLSFTPGIDKIAGRLEPSPLYHDVKEQENSVYDHAFDLLFSDKTRSSLSRVN